MKLKVLLIVSLSISVYSDTNQFISEVTRSQKIVKMIDALNLKLLLIAKDQMQPTIKNPPERFAFIDRENSNELCDDIYIFIDQNNKIRKVQSIFETIDHLYQSEYYDENGELCFAQAFMESENCGEWVGTFYCKGKSIYSISAYSDRGFDGKRLDSMKPVKQLGGLCFLQFHFTTKDFREYEQLISLNIRNASLYQCSSLMPYDVTFVNSTNVNVRNEPNQKGVVLDTINVLRNSITIRSIENEEQIEPWGKYHWYKIAYSGSRSELSSNGKIEGYIFGSFLEPVYLKKTK
jgi:hypothetical protein